MGPRNPLWLGLSGVTTSLFWIFYDKALQVGDVDTVALIAKGSVVVAMLLAWFVLREVITRRMILGGGPDCGRVGRDREEALNFLADRPGTGGTCTDCNQA